MVAALVVSTRANAASASAAPTSSASFTEMRPAVTGLWAVRFTCLSKSRSATSFTQQPALRISTVPSVNTASRCQPGNPCAAIHSALRLGHSSSSQPAGRSHRIRSSQSASRCGTSIEAQAAQVELAVAHRRAPEVRAGDRLRQLEHTIDDAVVQPGHSPHLGLERTEGAAERDEHQAGLRARQPGHRTAKDEGFRLEALLRGALDMREVRCVLDLLVVGQATADAVVLLILRHLLERIEVV